VLGLALVARSGRAARLAHLGVVTALMGAPFLFSLIYRLRGTA